VFVPDARLGVGVSCEGTLELVQGDLLGLCGLVSDEERAAGRVELVTCMGDTLTHLQVTAPEGGRGGEGLIRAGGMMHKRTYHP
jgi:hypothetical protein